MAERFEPKHIKNFNAGFDRINNDNYSLFNMDDVLKHKEWFDESKLTELSQTQTLSTKLIQERLSKILKPDISPDAITNLFEKRFVSKQDIAPYSDLFNEQLDTLFEKHNPPGYITSGKLEYAILPDQDIDSVYTELETKCTSYLPNDMFERVLESNGMEPDEDELNDMKEDLYGMEDSDDEDDEEEEQAQEKKEGEENSTTTTIVVKPDSEPKPPKLVDNTHVFSKQKFIELMGDHAKPFPSTEDIDEAVKALDETSAKRGTITVPKFEELTTNVGEPFKNGQEKGCVKLFTDTYEPGEDKNEVSLKEMVGFLEVIIENSTF